MEIKEFTKIFSYIKLLKMIKRQLISPTFSIN
jgi:hypothetical protein